MTRVMMNDTCAPFNPRFSTHKEQGQKAQHKEKGSRPLVCDVWKWQPFPSVERMLSISFFLLLLPAAQC